MSDIKTNKVNKTPKKDTSTSDEFLRYIAMNGCAPTAVIKAPEMRLLFVNNLFKQHLGYSNADVEENGTSFNELLEKNQHSRLIYQLNKVKENPEAQSQFLMYMLTGKDGNAIPYYVYAAPIDMGDSAQGELYHLTLHPDFSRWDMPFTSFVTRELFLEQFKSEHFGTFEQLLHEDMVFWSQGVYKIYEVDANYLDVNNKFVNSFIHPGDRERVNAAVAVTFDTAVDLNMEFRIVTAKQNTKIIHCLAKIIKNKKGQSIKFAGSVRDITEQRQIEDDLKNKVEELYHSNRELTEFAYVASHDMQEPLRKITTFSDRLLEKYKDVLTGDGAMYLARMTASAANMRALINDLLEFSRISKTILPFEPVNLQHILKQVLTDLELVIEETGTVVHTDSLPEIDAVPSQITQLFTNIINNAIKFHKEGIAPCIEIKSEKFRQDEKYPFELDKNADYYKIEITDNGIGFESEYATRIFQVFQRLHGKSEYPGSGIGLAICKKILEYHSGIIYAENVEGIGARFTFIIPKKQNDH